MDYLERNFLSSQTLQPDLYTRYTDDIFLIWPHGKESLLEFHRAFDSFPPTIKLIMDYSPSSVTFLDTRITIVNNKLVTSLYRKPTDNITMLHSTSFHPKHVLNSIPYGQAIRIHRICSDENDRDTHLNTLRSAFLRSGYDAGLVNRQFHRATQRDRKELLTRNNRTDSEPRVPLVVTYFPGADKLRTTLRPTQHLIDNDPYLRRVLPLPPLLAIRQPQNLKQTLVRSKLPSLTPTQNGTQPCNKPRCLTCPLIDTNTTVTRHGIIHNVNGNFNCNSTNLVYLIRCRQECDDAWYIGETKQTLRERLNGHRATIRNRSTLPVGEHFSTLRHCESDIKVTVLQGNLSDTHERRTTEQRLIAKFRTHQKGLNRDLGFMSRYT